jgi:hypothetical protein
LKAPAALSRFDVQSSRVQAVCPRSLKRFLAAITLDAILVAVSLSTPCSRVIPNVFSRVIPNIFSRVIPNIFSRVIPNVERNLQLGTKAEDGGNCGEIPRC